MTALRRWLGRLHRDESGSIPMVMIVLVVTSGLIVAMTNDVLSGVKLTRHEGDSASALQLADAGINDAVERLPTVAVSAGCTGTTAICFSRTGTIGGGTYLYTATRDAVTTTLWHIDSVGTDSSGVMRRVQADASGESQFVSPLYVKGAMVLSAGATLDSFTSGLNTSSGCTGKGIIGLANGGSTNPSFGSNGGGNANCTKMIDGSWIYSMDGCTVYGGSSLPPTGSAKCPPSNTHIVSKTFALPDEPNPTIAIGTNTYAPAAPVTTFNCSTSTGLKGGHTYYYATVNLLGGCGVDPATVNNGPATVIGTNIYVGNSSSQGGSINAPTTTTCPGTSSWTYTDLNKNPKVFYCAKWSQELMVYAKGNGSVTFQGNGTTFWGVISAPNQPVSMTAPQAELWGAMVAGSVNVASQFSWHYDEYLMAVTNGKFSLSNWREIPR